MPIRISKDETFKKVLDQNIAYRYKSKKRTENIIHVSDIILESSCLRKSYYSRKLENVNDVAKEQALNFLRGESSEKVLSELLDLGVKQATLQLNGLLAHPDIMKRNNDESDLIVELKDSNSFTRFTPSHLTFKGYMRQLIYYMVMSGIEKGLLVIKYNLSEMEYLQRQDAGDIYCRLRNGAKPSIETWNVSLPLDSEIRVLLKEQILERKDRLLEALKNDNVKSLPRLTGDLKRLKCGGCVFYGRCYEDPQSLDAITWDIQQQESDVLKMSGVIKVDDDNNND